MYYFYDVPRCLCNVRATIVVDSGCILYIVYSNKSWRLTYTNKATHSSILCKVVTTSLLIGCVESNNHKAILCARHIYPVIFIPTYTLVSWPYAW